MHAEPVRSATMQGTHAPPHHHQLLSPPSHHFASSLPPSSSSSRPEGRGQLASSKLAMHAKQSALSSSDLQARLSSTLKMNGTLDALKV
eukprot:758214-Hanusia_phi.AAC.1